MSSSAVIRFDFELLREQTVPEINTHARLFRHIPTGAELLSLENDDENKVFGVTLRTPPVDSTGVAHILEHSVLCGSDRYPVKEPFVELVKGSLATFVNAFTYPDKTCYPVASQNLQDFYNLIDVYMDAVLHPRLEAHTFDQEGWHYELDTPDGDLSYKGIVFNEMKGAYSDPDNLLDRYTRLALFPDNAYGVDSGGDPRSIPDLDHAGLQAFHAAYYHPSNARFFFYGNDDPQERLRRLQEYLQGYTAQPVNSTIALQAPFTQPRQVTIPYEVNAEGPGNKAMAVIAWVLGETADAEHRLGLQILGYILIGTPASPLRKALIDCGLGEDLAGFGIESELRQVGFSSGLKGIAIENAGRVQDLIWDTLRRLAADGLEADMVAAAMNTIEFRLRENNTGSFPRGLSLMLRALTTWLYDGDPLAPLAFDAPLAGIKARLAAGERYFEGLIQRHLLDNPHRAVVILEPQAGLRQQQEAAEKARLEAFQAGLSAQERQALYANTQALKRRQETPDTPQALATLPGLKLADLEPRNKITPTSFLAVSGVRTCYHDLFTNGILYLDLGFDLHALPQRLLPYIPLFSRALLEMGTQKEDFVRFSQRLGRTTGGIRPTTYTSMVRNTHQDTAWVFWRSKATPAQAADLLAILEDMFLIPQLDNPTRFRQMALEDKASYEAGLIPGGHRVVNARLRAGFSVADWAAEQMGGVSNLFFLRDLLGRIDSDWPGVLADLHEIQHCLLQQENLLVNVTVHDQAWQAFEPQLAEFLGRLSHAAPGCPPWQPELITGDEGLAIPAQVNYVGKAANLYDLGYRLHGSALVISNYLHTTWLWEKVRMQGGAYGAFSVFDTRSGVYSFLSYRDPNLAATLANFDQSAQYLRHLELSQDELTKSIIGVIGDLDSYQLPDARGYTALLRHLSGDTEASRQQLRDEVLAATAQDFQAFGEILNQFSTAGRVVVMGSQEALQTANAEQAGRLTIHQIL